MNNNLPDWYMTTQEFADLVVQSLETSNHFKRHERAHPEDIVIAFVSHAEAIAIGAGAVGKKMYKKKNAVMETKDLKKNNEAQSQDEFLGYSEWMHKKIKD